MPQTELEYATSPLPVTFAFELNTPAGCESSDKIAALGETVTLDLAYGAQYLVTAGAPDATAGRSLARLFVELSAADLSQHRFSPALSLLVFPEQKRGASMIFAPLVSVSFMSEFADTTWFSPLDALWGSVLGPEGHRFVCSKKDPDAQGPDSLAAPFDPRTCPGPYDAIFVLEFKGRKEAVKFDHSQFDEWRKQAANIDVRRTDGSVLRLKSWVLAFNYACEGEPHCREVSALLVEDPWTTDKKAPPPDPEFLIRHHLARQCMRLGYPGLARHVLQGTMPERPQELPPVFTVLHPRLRGRHYVRATKTANPALASLSQHDRPPLGVRVHVFDDGPPGGFHVCWEDSTREAHVSVDGPRETAQQIAATVWRALVGVDGSGVAWGQDAAMLRACMRTAPGDGLAHWSLRDPLQARGVVDPETPTAPQGAFQVIRNGSLLASSALLRLTEGADFWHQE